VSGGRARRRLEVLLALSSPLLALLGLVALLRRSGSDRLPAVPALLIGCALLITTLVRRGRRRRELLRALRQERQPPLSS
jgi:hypothetical protein